MRTAPPIVPGIQDKNSYPDNEFFKAKLETCFQEAGSMGVE